MPSKKLFNGIGAALSSALFLGLAPVFGKQAILMGFSPLAVVALRSGLAALVLLIIMAIFKRGFFYIYPVGLVGCLLAGFVNGFGSILYYSALSRLDASIGQLLYSFYPLFVAFWLAMDRQPVSRLTAFRLLLSIPGMFLLLSTGEHQIDLLGALMMLGAAIFYALHLIINQRVLYEVPAPTVTLYTLLAMGATVLIAFLLFNPQLPTPGPIYWPVLAMALITFFSRITLFMGIKHLGGMQTALLGLGELFVTVGISLIWLNEHLTPLQWLGAALLAGSLFLVGFDHFPPAKRNTTGLLSWLNPPQIRPDLPWRT
jgi:drug/metabolite transporter (DMT)-like permease